MWTEEKLDELLSTPSKKLIEDIKKIKGDIMVLGAGGKMGPTLCLLIKKAIDEAEVTKKVTAVSRFSDPIALKLLEGNNIETISIDLLDIEKLNKLPECENIIYMAGRKFGTDGQEALTWAMNSTLSSFVAYKFRKSNIVVFSSGNIYPLVPLSSGGCTENDKVSPVGEYAMSTLARERAFEYASIEYGTKIFLYRLNFALDLRYGVLHDIATNILNDKPINLSTPCLNFIWQGTANEIAIRGLLHCSSPATKMNVTGPENISIKYAAEKLAELFGRDVVFEGKEQETAYLNNSSKAMETFGYPSVAAETLIKWQAEWLMDGGRGLGKRTSFEERRGAY